MNIPDQEYIALLEERTQLLELVALICRDGGHYYQEHGEQKTVAHCVEEWTKLITKAEAYDSIE